MRNEWKRKAKWNIQEIRQIEKSAVIIFIKNYINNYLIYTLKKNPIKISFQTKWLKISEWTTTLKDINM